MTKLCRRCSTVKPLEDFYSVKPGPKTAKDGRTSRCIECMKELAKEQYGNGYRLPVERRREILGEFRKRNPRKGSEYGRRWREKNGERARELQRARGQKWRQTKPEGHIVSEMRRRARLQEVTSLDQEYVALLRNDPCSYCGTPALPVDHIEPLYRGGAAGWKNMTAACTKCNASKGTDSLLPFLLRTAQRS